MEHEQGFTPEEVDEQIEQLLQANTTDETATEQSDAHMVRQLHDLYQAPTQTEAIERVRQQLLHRRHETTPPPYTVAPPALLSPEKPRFISRKTLHLLESLAAVLVAAVVVSSIVVMLHFYHSGSGSATYIGDNTNCVQRNSPGVYAAYASTVYKYNELTGATIWEYDTKDPLKPFSVAPTVVGNSVYISSGNALYVLDATTGIERWQKQWGRTLPSASSIPTVICDTVALLASDNMLHMLNASTGKELWARPGVSIIAQTPITGTTFYSMLPSSKDDQLQAINAKSGATLWSTTALKSSEDPSSFRLIETAVANNNTIYASFSRYTGGGFFRAFDTLNGAQLWSVNLRAGYEFSHLQVNNRIAYLTATPVNNSKDVYEEAYNTNDGTRLWSFKVGASIVDSPTIKYNTLTFSTQNGYVYALNARTGQQSWSYHADGAINLTARDNVNTYIEVGDSHVTQGASGGQPVFTPRYIVALDLAGKEQQRYPVQQGLSPTLLAVGDGNIYLVGTSDIQHTQFYNIVAISLVYKSSAWQTKIKNFPPTGLFPVVVLASTA